MARQSTLRRARTKGTSLPVQDEPGPNAQQATGHLALLRGEIRSLTTPRLVRLLEAERANNALVLCNLAIAKEPHHYATYAQRAVVLLETIRLDEALSDNDVAIRSDQALSDSNHSITLAPKDGDLYFVRGMARHSLHQYSEAKSDFDLSIELGANAPILDQIRTRLLKEINEILINQQKDEPVSRGTGYTDGVNGETITPAEEPGSSRSRQSLPVRETRHELTRPAQIEWPQGYWLKSSDKAFHKQGAIVKYLRKVWMPFLTQTSAVLTLEILDQKDEGAGTALRKYLRYRPMPDDLSAQKTDGSLRAGFVTASQLKARMGTAPMIMHFTHG